MSAKSAVIVVLDRLGAGWLGPYGNTWVETPNFNRLAAQSVLYETVIADSPDLEMAYRSYWSGRHALARSGEATALLPSLAQRDGAASYLVTDDPAVAAHPLSSSFVRRELVRQSEVDRCADQVDETALFRFFAGAIAVLGDWDGTGLLWIHSRGMAGPWDAPLAMRNQFADEDDPQPPSFVMPAERRLAQDFDPDELLGFVHAYASQVALADECLGMFLDALEEEVWSRDSILVVTSLRGYPLGEHLRVGPCDEALYGELLHVPLLARMPEKTETLARIGRIMQPHEIYHLIARRCEWLSSSEGVEDDFGGEERVRGGRAVTKGNGQRAIRTPAWFLRESREQSEPQLELFAKPDDRWEANEVASRCGEAAEMLAAELSRFEDAARADRIAELPPLDEILCDVWR